MARRTADLGMGIAGRLKQAQKAAELTVRELAERSHVTAPTIIGLGG
jgi:transcriptional regulator with XRE-family HTH domain